MTGWTPILARAILAAGAGSAPPPGSAVPAFVAPTPATGDATVLIDPSAGGVVLAIPVESSTLSLPPDEPALIIRTNSAIALVVSNGQPQPVVLIPGGVVISP